MRVGRSLRLTVLVFGVALAARASGVEMPIPPMGAVESGEYRARDFETGEDLWQHRWRLERRTTEKQIAVAVTQAGHGHREYPQPVSWSVHVDVWLGGERIRLWARREVRGAGGELLQIEERDLDPTQKMGMITRKRGVGGPPEVRRFLLSHRTVDVEFLAFALRLLPMAADQRMRFDLVTSDGNVVGMEAKIVGREVVRVPAGSFECYKILIAPTGVLGLMANLLLPQMHTWLSVEPPYPWVKSQGAEEGIGSREILRELVRFESQPG